MLKQTMAALLPEDPCWGPGEAEWLAVQGNQSPQPVLHAALSRVALTKVRSSASDSVFHFCRAVSRQCTEKLSCRDSRKREKELYGNIVYRAKASKLYF